MYITHCRLNHLENPLGYSLPLVMLMKHMGMDDTMIQKVETTLAEISVQ